jgi:hypothetical protein
MKRVARRSGRSSESPQTHRLLAAHYNEGVTPMTTQTAGRQPDGQPKHRDTAAKHLSEASDYLNRGALELAQTHALLAIGHALVDLAKDGIEVFQQTP